jgi:hypothetical protein
MSNLAVRIRVRPSRLRHPYRPLSPTTRPSVALPTTLPPSPWKPRASSLFRPRRCNSDAVAARVGGVFIARDVTMVITAPLAAGNGKQAGSTTYNTLAGFDVVRSTIDAAECVCQSAALHS